MAKLPKPEWLPLWDAYGIVSGKTGAAFNDVARSVNIGDNSGHDVGAKTSQLRLI